MRMPLGDSPRTATEPPPTATEPPPRNSRGWWDLGPVLQRAASEGHPSSEESSSSESWEAAWVDRASLRRVTERSRQAVRTFTEFRVGLQQADIATEEKMGLGQTTTSIVNLLVGAGMLQYPYMFHVSGWSASGLIVLIMLMFAFTGTLFARCLQRAQCETSAGDETPAEQETETETAAGSEGEEGICSAEVTKPKISVRRELDMPEVARITFGAPGELIVGLWVAVDLGMSGAYFLTLVSVNAMEILTQFRLGPPQDSSAIVTLVVCLAAYGLLFVPDRMLGVFSSVGVLAMVACVLALIISAVAMPENASAQVKPFFVDAPGLITAVGIVSGSFAGTPELAFIYSHCGPKERFGTALFRGYSISGLFLMFIGVFGYHFYGTFVAQVFTLNLGESLDGIGLPGLDFLQWVPIVAISIKLLVTCPFLVLPIAIQLEGVLGCVLPCRLKVARVLSRTMTMALITLVAVVSTQNVAMLMAIIGNVLTMGCSAAFPCAFYIAMFGTAEKVNFALATIILITAIVWPVYSIYGL